MDLNALSIPIYGPHRALVTNFDERHLKIRTVGPFKTS